MASEAARERAERLIDDGSAQVLSDYGWKNAREDIADAFDKPARAALEATRAD